MAAVVQNEHDGIEPVTHRRGQLHPRHLKRAERGLVAEAQHVVAGDAKHVADAVSVKRLGQVFSDADRAFHCHGLC